MILSAPLPWDDHEWHQILKNSIRNGGALRRALGLKKEETSWLEDPSFRVHVPLPYLDRIEKANPRDPLLLQVAPDIQESEFLPGYSTDALEEKASEVASGTLRKYSGRLLFIASPSCPIHCRYCFRQHTSFQDSLDKSTMKMLDVVKRDPTIFEVILSGGDPLMRSDDQLAALLSLIDDVPHVKVIRIHTRFCVAIPHRVTRGLLDGLNSLQSRMVVVLHINHANEIDSDVTAACNALRDANVVLLNQSVLLRGVNNDVETLADLSRSLIQSHVVPYYLHLPDKVQGTGHFDVDESKAKSLHLSLQAKLPGYLVPRLVREVPGEESKVLIQ